MNVRVIACCVWAEQKVLPPDLYLSWKGRNWKVKEIMSESLLLIAVTDYFTYTFLLLGTNVLCHLFSLSVSLCCACFFIPSSVFFFRAIDFNEHFLSSKLTCTEKCCCPCVEYPKAFRRGGERRAAEKFVCQFARFYFA